jgi:hypothetical protein
VLIRKEEEECSNPEPCSLAGARSCALALFWKSYNTFELNEKSQFLACQFMSFGTEIFAPTDVALNHPHSPRHIKESHD